MSLLNRGDMSVNLIRDSVRLQNIRYQYMVNLKLNNAKERLYKRRLYFIISFLLLIHTKIT